MGNLRKTMRREYVLTHMGHIATWVLGGILVFMLLPAIGFYRVRGDGMEPNLKAGNMIAVSNIAYRARDPKRGDVVITDGKLFRVIGLPGEVLTIRGGRLFLDGNLVKEPYLPETSLTWPNGERDTFVLGKNDYFLLSDNRSFYDDSRAGVLYHKEDIGSKVIFFL